MSANKKSSLLMLCLSLPLVCLLGVLAIMDASSANASPGEAASSATVLQSSIIISPTELQATLHPDELLTQTLWITNTGDTDLSFTIYELTASLHLANAAVELSIPDTFPSDTPTTEDASIQTQLLLWGQSRLIV